VAVVYRVPNGKIGDGAGRSRYLLSDMEKVLGIRTNAPLSLSPLPDKSLANDWNRFLKSWQGNYRTTHLIVSFPQLLNKEQIEEVFEYLDQKLPEYVGEDRFRLIVVHREVFNEESLTPEEILEVGKGKRESPRKIDGTAFHIVLSADSQGKLLRLRPSEFKKMKLEISEYLTKKFGNEREKEVLRNFRRGIRTRDPFKQGEIKAPEKLEKVRARQLLKEITQALEQGDIDRAIRIQRKNHIEFKELKKGQLSPWNKQKLKEDTVYLFMPKFDGSGIFSMRLTKKATVLWRQYQTVFSEVGNELGSIETKARQDRERTEELRDEIKAHKRANTEFRKRIGELAKRSKDLERKTLQLGERIRRAVQQAQNFDGREPEIVEFEQAIRTANSLIAEDREFERRDFERIRNEIEHIYEQVREEFGITREELEKEDYRSRSELENEDSRFRADGRENEEFRGENIGLGEQIANGGRGRERKETSPSVRSNGHSLYKVHEGCRKRDNKSGRVYEGSNGNRDENMGRGKGSTRRTPEWDADCLDRAGNTCSSFPGRVFPKVKKIEKEEKVWTLNGEEITEEEIKGNPAFFLDCEIEEVRKLAHNFLMEELDEEYQFLEAEGYFRDIEEFERLEREMEIRREQEREQDSSMGLEL
jgi:hypothetical protein